MVPVLTCSTVGRLVNDVFSSLPPATIARLDKTYLLTMVAYCISAGTCGMQLQLVSRWGRHWLACRLESAAAGHTAMFLCSIHSVLYVVAAAAETRCEKMMSAR